MKHTFLFMAVLSVFFLFVRCKEETCMINEKVEVEIVEFVSNNDFSGYFRVGDNIVDTIRTCLSATLYDIDTNHYMTVILYRIPADAFMGTPYYQQNSHPVMCFSVGEKELFVYDHSHNGPLLFSPRKTYSEDEVRKIEMKYITDDIDDRFVIQTYRYGLNDGKIWIEKDSTFDFFKWCYGSSSSM